MSEIVECTVWTNCMGRYISEARDLVCRVSAVVELETLLNFSVETERYDHRPFG